MVDEISSSEMIVSQRRFQKFTLKTLLSGLKSFSGKGFIIYVVKGKASSPTQTGSRLNGLVMV